MMNKTSDIKEKNTKSLTNLDQGESGKIIELSSGSEFRKRMTELGFGKGSDIRMIRRSSSGPLIVEIKGCGRIAIGRGEASKILVRVGD